MRHVLSAMLTSLIVLAGVDSAVAADLDANKLPVRNYIETVINKRQPDAAANYFAADFVEHNPRLPAGLAGKKQFLASLMAGFSDYHGEIAEIMAEATKSPLARAGPARRMDHFLAARRPAISLTSPPPISTGSRMAKSSSTGTWLTH